jgi:hypothetical protein
MDLQLSPQAGPNGEPTYWVAAKVYRKGESSPLYTGAVDLMQDPPVVHVPKGSLKAGTYRYEIVINNGVRDSSRSPDPGFGIDQAVNAVYSTTYKLTAGQFDFQTGRLTLTTSGLASSGTFNPNLLSIVKDDNRVSLGSVTVTVTSVASTSVVLQAPELATALDPDVYHGPVLIEAEDGWFASADGSVVAQASASAVLKPLATISDRPWMSQTACSIYTVRGSHRAP